MKKLYTKKAIAIYLILLILGLSFWWGGNSPALHGWNVKSNSQTINNNKDDIPKKVQPEDNKKTDNDTIRKTNANESDSLNNDYETQSVKNEKPQPVEPQNAVVTKKENTCSLKVSCKTVLSDIGYLDEEKRKLIPDDGIVFSQDNVVFYDGESVFNVLLREMKKNKIHFEFVNTPVYNSAYIEGINNLYEFDCGELSGWMYKVNDWFPNYGCSRYKINDGDKIEVIYTCNLGKDIGGEYAANKQKDD